MKISAFHHVTAVTANIGQNYRFYTQVLGLRLVKRSVNQDDVSAYHLFFADGAGSPGTDMTFFDWDMPREERGTRSVTRTGFRVRSAANMEWWAGHLQKHGVQAAPVQSIDGRATLEFEDPEGQRLALVEDGGAGDTPVLWHQSPVPAEHQIRGLGPVVMSVPQLWRTDEVLKRVMGFEVLRQYEHPARPGETIHVYGMGQSGPQAELHVAEQPNLATGRLGAGGVHHIAFRTPKDDEYHAWARRLNEMGVRNSGEVDRYYFKSLYFREPGGVLFEIATDGPGFASDEDMATLGEKVALPPFLEPHREQIVANLKPLE